MDEKAQKEEARNFLGCLVVTVVAVLCVFFSCRNYKPSPESIAEGDRAEAWYYAQQFAKKELISPKTAEFPSIHTEGVKVTTIAENSFFVTGFVDAQNSYGAMIRKRFEAEITHVGNKWRLERLRWLD